MRHAHRRSKSLRGKLLSPRLPLTVLAGAVGLVLLPLRPFAGAAFAGGADMRQSLRRNIPSMFHRRLLLLIIAGIGVATVLSARAAQLTIGPGSEARRTAAENALQATELIPTVRGRIFDAKDRRLAMDQPGWNVCVDYSVIEGAWAYDRATRAAKNAHRDEWPELSLAEKEMLIQAELPVYEGQTEAMWEVLAGLGGVTREELEARRDRIRLRVQQLRGHVWERWRQRRQAELDQPVSLADVAQPLREEKEAHPLLYDVSEDAQVGFQSFMAEAERDEAVAVWRQVKFERPRQRGNPLETLEIEYDRSTLPEPIRNDEPVALTVEGVGVHLIGTMRDVWKEDFDGSGLPRFDRAEQPDGYLVGDRVGSFGIERGLESILRGQRGYKIRHRDTGVDEIKRDPLPGSDVRLTIDISLQARIQAAMSPEIGLLKAQSWHVRDGEEYDPDLQFNGAAAVVDVATGNVLAAVSMPAMSRRLMREDPNAIFRDAENAPFVSRAVGRSYPPGSTIKPVMLVAAMTTHQTNHGRQILCTGTLDPNNRNRYRCWIWSVAKTGHGLLNGEHAIEHSCNVYFYTLGREMGARRTAHWYQQFGLGTLAGLGLPEESPGDLPDLARADERGVPGFASHDAIQMGIGQGPVGWTPVQAAAAYGTLARDGYYIAPAVVSDPVMPRERRQLSVSTQGLRDAIEGMRLVVHGDRGTARSLRTGEPIFNTEGVDIIGKSGTAQPGARWIDRNFDGKIDPGEVIEKPGNHAWFTALVRPEGAREWKYAIAVVVEHAGSGGQVSGPVANQIVHALIAEGYL